MFDDKNIQDIDQLFNSVLANAEEEVPAHVWDGVSKGLDKATSRKVVVLWFRRIGIAAAGAAAVILCLLILNTNEQTSRPESKVIADAEVVTDIRTSIEDSQLLALAEDTEPTETAYKSVYRPAAIPNKKDQITTSSAPTSDVAPAAEAIAEEKTEHPKAVPAKTHKEVNKQIQESQWVDEWEDDIKEEKKNKKIRTSLVISGVAGTNSPQNKSSIGPFKSSGLLKVPTKTTLEQVGSKSYFGVPVSAGIGVKINFNEKWALGMGVNYTLLTSKFEGKYTKVEDGIVSPNITADVRNHQHFVGIPVNAYYNIVNRDFINFYTYVGGTVEKCVSNKYQILTETPINHTEQAKGVQLSANVGLGVEFLAGEHVGIYIDPSLRYYFNGKQPPSIRTSQPLMLGLEMGVRFNL